MMAAPTTAPPASPEPAEIGFQPLWRFTSPEEAASWQDSYREGGHQLWHLDPAQTTLGFAGYLGNTGIDTVVGTSSQEQEAWVDVGYLNPNRVAVTAATLHLVRIGTGADAPWEVVGTEDTTPTLSNPAYGAVVQSPVTVGGGNITGVDESLGVQTRSASGPAPVGTSDAIPAGGTSAPWSTTVAYSAAPDAVLTIAVATGGHVAEVERFAVTGVRNAK